MIVRLPAWGPGGFASEERARGGVGRWRCPGFELGALLMIYHYLAKDIIRLLSLDSIYLLEIKVESSGAKGMISPAHSQTTRKPRKLDIAQPAKKKKKKRTQYITEFP